MDEPLMDREGTWEDVTADIPDFAKQKVRVIVFPVKDNAPVEVSPTEGLLTLEEIFASLNLNVPAEELAKIPADFTSQLDHYAYGTPKR